MQGRAQENVQFVAVCKPEDSAGLQSLWKEILVPESPVLPDGEWEGAAGKRQTGVEEIASHDQGVLRFCV